MFVLPNTRDAALVALFGRHGFVRSDVAVLQPSEPFIELSGEDIRRRLFLVSDTAGEETCLRPEFTIPAARAHIASAKAKDVAGYGFLGPVFRQRTEGSGEFLQASVELFGRKDIEAADADMLAFAIEAEAVLGGKGLTIRIGDVGLTAALIEALELPAVVARRVRQNGFSQSGAETASTNSSPSGLAAYQGVLSALRGADPAEARAFVKDILSIAGLKAVGGRTAGEIADRFLEKAADDGTGLSMEQAEILRRFKTISGDPDAVTAELRVLADFAGLDMTEALDRFEQRTGFMAARGIDLSRLEMSTAFARNLDYYSGFVFEFVTKAGERPAIAGGRYDALLRRLGAADTPAIGCAIWLERFGEPA